MAATVKELGAEIARALPEDPDAWLARARRQYDKGRFRAAAAAAAIAQALYLRRSADPVVVVSGIDSALQKLAQEGR